MVTALFKQFKVFNFIFLLIYFMLELCLVMINNVVSCVNLFAANRWVRLTFGLGSVGAAMAYIRNQKMHEQFVRGCAEFNVTQRTHLQGFDTDLPVDAPHQAQPPGRDSFGKALHEEIGRILPFMRLLGTPPPKLEDQLRELSQEIPKESWAEWGLSTLLEGKNRRIGAVKFIQAVLGSALGAKSVVDGLTGNYLSKLIASKGDQKLKKMVCDRLVQRLRQPRQLSADECNAFLKSPLFVHALELSPLLYEEQLRIAKCDQFKANLLGGADESDEAKIKRLINPKLTGQALTEAAETWLKAMGSLSANDEEILKEKKLDDVYLALVEPLIAIVSDMIVDQAGSEIIDEAMRQFLPLIRKKEVSSLEWIIGALEVLHNVPEDSWEHLNFNHQEHHWFRLLSGVAMASIVCVDTKNSLSHQPKLERSEEDRWEQLNPILDAMLSADEISQIQQTLALTGALAPGEPGSENKADELQQLVHALIDPPLVTGKQIEPWIERAVEEATSEARLRNLFNTEGNIEALIQKAKEAGALSQLAQDLNQAERNEQAKSLLLEELSNLYDPTILLRKKLDGIIDNSDQLIQKLVEHDILNSHQIAFRHVQRGGSSLDEALRATLRGEEGAAQKLKNIMDRALDLQAALLERGSDSTWIDTAWETRAIIDFLEDKGTWFCDLLTRELENPSLATMKALQQWAARQTFLAEHHIQSLKRAVENQKEAIAQAKIRAVNNQHVRNIDLARYVKQSVRQAAARPFLLTVPPLLPPPSTEVCRQNVQRLQEKIGELLEAQFQASVKNRDALGKIFEVLFSDIEGVGHELIHLLTRETALKRTGILQHTIEDDLTIFHEGIQQVVPVLIDILLELCQKKKLDVPHLPRISSEVLSHSDQDSVNDLLNTKRLQQVALNQLNQVIKKGGVGLREALVKVIETVLEDVIAVTASELDANLQQEQDKLFELRAQLLEREHLLAGQTNQIKNSIENLDRQINELEALIAEDRKFIKTMDRLPLTQLRPHLPSEFADLNEQVMRANAGQWMDHKLRAHIATCDELCQRKDNLIQAKEFLEEQTTKLKNEIEQFQKQAIPYLQAAAVRPGIRLARIVLHTILEQIEEGNIDKRVSQVWAEASPLISSQLTTGHSPKPYQIVSALSRLFANG